MNQEIKQKLEQALADKLTNYIKQRHDQSRCVGYSDGVLAGAQTILENPSEWGLVHPHSQKLADEVLAMESQLAKYREALERIISNSKWSDSKDAWVALCRSVNIAKEALKQEDTK